uniref:Zgc:153345 n=1 Tax=Cyprinus carpio TaxID=7962 RepID=A0A8C1FY63_CYPCA
MAGLTEERLRVVVIIHALKAVGIRVKTWKNIINGDSNASLSYVESVSQECASQRFAFRRDLRLLPQHELSDMGGTVPQFLVEACRYLSQHLETEGLFRKTGSLSRIRALRVNSFKYDHVTLKTEVMAAKKNSFASTEMNSILKVTPLSKKSLPELEGSARKRRPLHDLREDTLTITQPEECVSSHSPLEEKCRKDPISTTSKKRNHIREQQKSLGYPQEEKVHRRRKSLRFFSVSSGNNNPENGLEEHQEQPDCKSDSPLTNADVSPKIPFILIDGPGEVVQETKVKTFKNYKQEKMADSTLGFKRPQLCLSVAERLRGLSALTLLLRTSCTAPQFQEKSQEALQRGPTCLRRQGARRFGRSISHEGVPERPLEQSPVGSPPANQAFIGIHDASPDSGVESVDHEPIIDFNHQEVCKMSQNYPKVQVTNDVDLDSLKQDAEELDLHKLLDQKCHIGGHGEDDHQDSNVPAEVLTPDLASPMFFQQMVPLKPFEDTRSVKMDQVSPLNGSEKETPSWLNDSPPFVFPNFAPLSFVGVIIEDLFPPAFQFGSVTARRHYRDSPYWPSHEVRMSAWNPLLL